MFKSTFLSLNHAHAPRLLHYFPSTLRTKVTKRFSSFLFVCLLYNAFEKLKRIIVSLKLVLNKYNINCKFNLKIMIVKPQSYLVLVTVFLYALIEKRKWNKREVLFRTSVGKCCSRWLDPLKLPIFIRSKNNVYLDPELLYAYFSRACSKNCHILTSQQKLQ